MSQPTLEKKETEHPSEISPDYRAELLSYQNRAMLGMVLGVISIPLSLFCIFPIGVFAFFLGVQAQVGLLKLDVTEGRDRARIARFCGGIGSVLFLIRLIIFLFQLLRSKNII